MVEVVYYSREMLSDLMNTWQTDKAFLTLDYVRFMQRLPHTAHGCFVQQHHLPSGCLVVSMQVCGIVNDTGVLLDHLENLESLFAETVRSETARGFGTTRLFVCGQRDSFE